MNKRLATLGLFLLSSILFLGAAELAFRAFRTDRAEKTRSNQPWRERLRRMNRDVYMAAEGDLVYQPRPNSSLDMPYGWAGFNASGMRDRREYPRHAPGRTRLAVIGDSLVWSEHLHWLYSLPSALDIELGDEALDVLNFGVSGYDITQVALWYEKAVRPYKPDLTLVVYCLNDAMIMSGPYNAYADDARKAYKKAQDDLFTETARLRAETIEVVGEQEESRATFKILARARTLYHQLTFEHSKDYIDEYLISYGDPKSMQRVQAALMRLGEAIRSDGGQAWLLISPLLRDWDNYRWQFIHDAVRKHAEAAGFKVLDPLPTWRKTLKPQFLRIEGDSLHYNPQGNFVLARSIKEALKPILKDLRLAKTSEAEPKAPAASE